MSRVDPEMNFNIQEIRRSTHNSIRHGPQEKKDPLLRRPKITFVRYNLSLWMQEHCEHKAFDII